MSREQPGVHCVRALMEEEGVEGSTGSTSRRNTPPGQREDLDRRTMRPLRSQSFSLTLL